MLSIFPIPSEAKQSLLSYNIFNQIIKFVVYLL